MKKIQLGGHRYKGKPIRGFALVDDEDFAWLNQWRWSLMSSESSRYPVRTKGGKNIFMHRAILNPPKGSMVDHIDRNTLNNQRSNLRLCLSANNCRNRKKREGLSSVYKGVSWRKIDKAWWATICFNYKIINLGQFSQEHHAAMAYDLAARDLHGEFAVLNFPEAIHGNNQKEKLWIH